MDEPPPPRVKDRTDRKPLGFRGRLLSQQVLWSKLQRCNITAIEYLRLTLKSAYRCCTWILHVPSRIMVVNPLRGIID